MNITIMIILLTAVALFGITVFIKYRRKQKYIRKKGQEGEAAVAQILFGLPDRKYIVFHDVMLHRENRTSQIDHVVISRYGIFVIETKNYSGYIRGKDKWEEWIQFAGRKKYFFRNPVRQNYGHIKALQELLDFPDKVFYSIIVFPDTTRLNVRSRKAIIPMSRLRRYIRFRWWRRLSKKEREEAAEQLRLHNDSSRAARKEHVREVKKIK
ncbi:MAG: nuclease-related domain-containing protein [Lachnospiraceae bacterium]|nr:nuclease-related domain-containing protein [Lachnospiraceae bacterium]